MTVASIPAFTDPVTILEGVTTFDFDFDVYDPSHVQVQITDASTGAISYLTYGTDYTVTLVAEPDVGGTVAVTASLTAGDEFVAYRDTSLAQSTNLPNQGAYFAATVEAELDRLAMVTQDMDREIDLSVRYPVGVSASGQLPVPSAGKSLVWNAGADGMENGPTSDQITSAQGYSVAAGAAQTAAELAQDYAEEWAQNDEDDAVSVAAGGDGSTDFSALHWAAKAAASAAQFTKASNAEVLAGTNDVNYVTPAGITSAYVNFNRQIATVESLVGTDNTASITAAQVSAGLAADADIRELRFLGRDYDFSDGGITIPADRAFTILSAGTGATHITWGTAAGFSYNVTTQAENAMRQFNFLGGAAMKSEFAGCVGFDLNWNQFPFALWNAGLIENVYFYTDDPAEYFSRFVTAHHAARLTLANLDGKNPRSGVAGVGYELTGYALDCDLINLRDSYVSNGIFINKYSGKLMQFTSGTGTWSVGDTLTFSGGSTAIFMGMIDSTSATPTFFAEMLTGSDPAVSETVTVTATQIGGTGATGTLSAIADRSWGQEGTKIIGGEDAGVQRGIYLYGDVDTTKKLNNTQIHNRHINATVECIRASFATVIEGKGLDLQIGADITAFAMVSAERVDVEGSITQAASGGVGYGVNASVGAATYGTEACDDIKCYFRKNDLLGTEYVLGAGVTNFEYNGGPNQDLKEWTAAVSAQTGTLTSYTEACYWRDRDNTAVASMDITVTDAGTGSNALRVQLPPGHTLAAACAGMFKNETAGIACYVEGEAGNTYVDIREYDGSTVIATGARIKGSFSYFIT